MELSSLTVTHSWYAYVHKNTYTKMANLHWGIRLASMSESDSLDSYIGTLPEGFRPNMNIEQIMYTKSGSRVKLTIRTDGLIYVTALTAITEGDVFVGHETFFTN